MIKQRSHEESVKENFKQFTTNTFLESLQALKSWLLKLKMAVCQKLISADQIHDAEPSTLGRHLIFEAALH